MKAGSPASVGRAVNRAILFLFMTLGYLILGAIAFLLAGLAGIALFIAMTQFFLAYLNESPTLSQGLRQRLQLSVRPDYDAAKRRFATVSLVALGLLWLCVALASALFFNVWPLHSML